MKNEGLYWGVAGLSAAGLGLLVALGASGAGVLLMAGLATIVMAAFATTLRRPVDRSWLARWVTLGFAAKILGAFARYYMVQTIYESGDALRYYAVGTEYAAIWRSGSVPPLSGSGSFGTQVVEAFTGGFFAFLTPDILGGFVMFSMLSFLGQLGMYAAFRRWAKPHQLKPYAFMVLFLPTYAFWPSSIGKDALVILGLGVAAYCVARLLEGYQVRWIIALGISLAALGLVRIHVAGLVAVSLLGAAAVSRLRTGAGAVVAGRRVLTLIATAGVGILVLGLVPLLLGIDLANSADLLPFTDEIVRRTSEAGTVAAGGAVRSIADVPGALALVLFRPYVFEATAFQHFLAAAETTLFLALTVWKLPAILRHRKEFRVNAYLVFCAFYTISFAIAFSVIRNLGIIARQRGQVMAFFLAVIIGLGWEKRTTRKRVPLYVMPAEEPRLMTGPAGAIPASPPQPALTPTPPHMRSNRQRLPRSR